MSALSNLLIENKALMFGAAAVAFFVAAVLILLVFRLAFGRRLRMQGGRARQMRLGIVDAFDLDRQRQLVIVRRDNVEHLIMIGGPNDIVIETQILRTEAREMRGRDKEVREREPGHVPAPSVKSPVVEPKLPIPPLPHFAPEPQPVAAIEPVEPTGLPPLPGPAPARPGSSAPGTRRPPPTPTLKPTPTQPVSSEADHPSEPPAPKPAAEPAQPAAAAFMRWPARTAATPPAPPKRTVPKPPIPLARPAPAAPEPPPPEAGPPMPSLEGLESLEEEMAKLLGRGPTKP